MKKALFAIAGMCLFLFTGCLSPKIVNFDYKKKAAEGTPENSVVFVVYYRDNVQMYWSQSDSEYQPDYQQLEGPVFVSAPVAPGSRYRLVYCYGSYVVGNTRVYWNPNYSMQENYFDIKVPDEPGIYYVGAFEGSDSYRYGKNINAKSLIKVSDEKWETMCLKEALKRYKGTAWEPVIKAEIEEVK